MNDLRISWSVAKSFLSVLVGILLDEGKIASIDTHVIGMVVRGATGRTIPDLLSGKIIKPLGLEKQPYLCH